MVLDWAFRQFQDLLPGVIDAEIGAEKIGEIEKFGEIEPAEDFEMAEETGEIVMHEELRDLGEVEKTEKAP